MLEVFEHTFMNRALLVGLCTAVSTAMLGNFIVSARQSAVSDMLWHSALAGVGLGVYWHLSPTLTGFIVTIIAGLLLWWLTRDARQAPEAISVLILTWSLAVALLLVHLNKNNPISLDTYLFWSILTITPTEAVGFIILNIIIIAVLLLFWRPFMVFVFDREFLHSRWKKYAYEILFILLISCMVGIGLKTIGGLLVSGLLVIPVLISQSMSRSFKGNVVASIAVNSIAVFVWVISSYYLDVPTSSSIILSLILIYVISQAVVQIKMKQ